MSLLDYIRDKVMVLLLNGLMMVLLAVFLYCSNNTQSTISIILITWAGLLVCYVLFDFRKRNLYFKRLNSTLNQLDKRYLIAEVMDPSYKLEDRLYQAILRKSNKSVIEKIQALEDEQQDYKDYIQSWIHEIKIPLTTMELLCENHKGEMSRKLQSEIAMVDHFVEMVLFYARAEKLYQDYVVSDLNLQFMVHEVIGRNKVFLIQNEMMLQVDCDVVVCTDKKWLEFVLSQLLMNAVKYKKTGTGLVRLYCEMVDDRVRLCVEDTGIGIKKSEIGRIFDKGFTGSNGRSKKHSTGIGLYLCQKLCTKLEVDLSVESQVNEYTKVMLTFPKRSYLSNL